jgi:pimeloyl-ACP methyl ester carboxylesterase
MAEIPTYYVMERDKGMAATVAPFIPSVAEIAQCKWLTEAEVDVYATEIRPDPIHRRASGLSGAARLGPQKHCRDAHVCRTIDVPSMFIGGKRDWGVYQTPGAAESMQKTACTRMVGFDLVDGAGHWVQQEQPEKVTELLTKFLQDQSPHDGHKR